MKKNLEFKERIMILEKSEKNLRYKAKSLEIWLYVSVSLLIAAGFKIFIS